MTHGVILGTSKRFPISGKPRGPGGYVGLDLTPAINFVSRTTTAIRAAASTTRIELDMVCYREHWFKCFADLYLHHTEGSVRDAEGPQLGPQASPGSSDTELAWSSY